MRRIRLTVALLAALLACAAFGVLAGPAGASHATSAGGRHPRSARATTCHRRRPAHAGAHRHARCAKRETHTRARRGGHHRRRHSARSRSGRRGFSQSHDPRRSGGRHRARPRDAGSHPAVIPAPGPDGTCADAALVPRPGDLERIRTATLCLVNRERARHGEPLLRLDGDIQQAAQHHSQDMAFGGYFDHVGPRGDTPLSRLRTSGYLYSNRLGYAIGENIAWGTTNLATPQAIVASWMASPEHRANILDRHYRDSAIGVSPHPPASLAHGEAGGIYTQDFGVIYTG